MTSRLHYSPSAMCPRVSMRLNKPRAKQTLANVRRSLSLGREMTADFLTLACYNAIATGQLGLLKAIYKTGKAPEVDKQGNTPLHVAAKCGQLRSLRWLLLHANIPLLARNARGETCAHVAALQGQLKCLQAVVQSRLERASVVAGERDNMGMTVLHHATIGNRDVVVQWLLQEFGKDLCLVKSCDGVLAIHLAAAAGNRGCTEVLARGCRASVNMRDVFGATPVFYSAQEGNLSCLQFLFEHVEGSLNIIAFEGMTSFLSAAEGGHLEVVKYILEKQGHEALLSTTNDGATVYHYVCSVGNASILRFLLDLPDTADLLRVSDAYDRTPAHDAAEHGHVICLKLLMEAGMSLYLPDKDGDTPLSLALRSGNPNCVMFAKAVADSTLDKNSMKILKKKLGSKFSHVSNIMTIQALSKEDAMTFKKSKNWCKKKMGQYESSHEMSDMMTLRQDAAAHPQAWPHWHRTLQSHRPARTSNRGIFRGEFILMRSSPPGTCARRDRRRLGSPQNGYLYAQRNRPCPISLPLQRHEYPTRIQQIEAEEDLDIDDLERFSQRTPLGMIQEYNGFHQGSRDSSLDDIKEEQEECFDTASIYSRSLPIVRRTNTRSDDATEYEEAKTVFSSSKKLFFAKRRKRKEEKEKLSTVQEDEYGDERSPSPEIDYSSDESGISGFEGQNGFSLSTSAESGHMKRLSCGSSDSAMRDSDGGSSVCSDVDGGVPTVQINVVHIEDDLDKKPSDDMSGYESSLPSSRIPADSDETAVFTFGDTTEDGASERGSVKTFPLPERPPWKSKGLVHMQMNARKFSSSSEEDGEIQIPSFLHAKKDNKQTQSTSLIDDEHLYSEITPLSENEGEKENAQVTYTQETTKQSNLSHSGAASLGLNSNSLADILKHSITNGTFKRTGRGIPVSHNTCNPVFSSENIVKDPSTLERRRNQSMARSDSSASQAVRQTDKETKQNVHDKSETGGNEERQHGVQVRDRQGRAERQVAEQGQMKEEKQMPDKKVKEEIRHLNKLNNDLRQTASDSDEGIGSHDDSAEQPDLKFDEKDDNEPKKRGLKIKELQEILIKKDLPFANPALILGIQAKKQEAKEPKRNPLTVPVPVRSRSGSCSDSDTEITLKPSAIVSPKRAAPPLPSVNTNTGALSQAPPAPPLPPCSTLPKVNKGVTATSGVRPASRKCERDPDKTYVSTMKLTERKGDLCFDEETKARISSIKSMLQRATFAEKPMGTMSLPRKISTVS